MVAKRAWWYQVVDGNLGHTDVDDCAQVISNPQTPPPTEHQRSADCDGAMVARSQILMTSSMATLLGTLTNETACDVHFSGTPPYATTFDTDRSEKILWGDFNSPPREQPSSADWVLHSGASVPYRSLPVTVRTPGPRWDGTH